MSAIIHNPHRSDGRLRCRSRSGYVLLMTPVADSMKSIALLRATTTTNNNNNNKSCYYGGYPTDLSGYAAAARCRSPRSPVADDTDDISVGRPSPPASAECYARLHDDGDGHGSDTSSSGGGSDYFEPLKKLGTVQIDKVSYGISDRKSYAPKRRAHRLHQQHQSLLSSPPPQPAPLLADGCPAGSGRIDMMTMTTATQQGGRTIAGSSAEDAQPAAGVKSFSIADILSHEPSSAGGKPTAAEEAAKIVRPWAEEYQPPCSSFVPPPPPPPPPAHRQPVVGALFPHSLFIQHLQHQQQQQQHHHHHQQHQHHHQHRPKSADYETSTCTSGRSSTDGSECCTSPEIASCTQSNPSLSSAAVNRKQQAAGKNNDNSSPLDALFQMTSKTFDQLHGDPSGAGKCNVFYKLFHLGYTIFIGRKPHVLKNLIFILFTNPPTVMNL